MDRHRLVQQQAGSNSPALPMRSPATAATRPWYAAPGKQQRWALGPTGSGFASTVFVVASESEKINNPATGSHNYAWSGKSGRGGSHNGGVRVNLAHCLGGTNSGFSTRQSDDPEAHALARQVAEDDLAATQDLRVEYIPGW